MRKQLTYSAKLTFLANKFASTCISVQPDLTSDT